ncbi:HIT family protein [Longispora urticae]
MTISHAPVGYECPFCLLVAGEVTSLTTQRDVIRRTTGATAIMSPHWWPNNHGHVLVVPNAHHENLYDLPPEAGHAVSDLVREMANAVRHSYGCAGVTVRQNNEPAGDQDVWHFHTHVYPRYPGDELFRAGTRPRLMPTGDRWSYADRLRARFARPDS